MAGDGLLQRIANTLASALRLPYAAVALRAGEIFSAGTQPEEGGVLSLPLTHQGEAVGELRLAPRGARDPFSPADLELLRELAVHVAVAAQAVELPAAVEVAAYRITQEALNNVVRHSGARHCRLALSVAGGGLRVEVSDDGSGIPAGAPAGIGLSSMRERAEELGGRLDVDTTEGGGTRLAAFLPCAMDG